MKKAIPILKALITDLEAVDVASIERRSEPKLEVLEKRYNLALANIFGSNSYEYQTYVLYFNKAPIDFGRYETPVSEIRMGYKQGIEEAILYLKSIIQEFEQKLIDSRETSDNELVPPSPGEALRDLHKEIFAKCYRLYEQGAYAEAVEKGFKVVKDRLRTLTGYERGSDAFGRGGLHIKGAVADHVDEDFNQGVKFLTMAIDHFRNEKSHTSNAKIDDPIRAHEYLRLSSLAMNLLENYDIKP